MERKNCRVDEEKKSRERGKSKREEKHRGAIKQEKRGKKTDNAQINEAKPTEKSLK